ncbi:UDP-3-O-(3-hydroxymyristoyl)glucosamine N-acyltransferase [Roseococcus sp. SYP-B2431]|uniref:UDP-3-O-(3-hydroxymyristoyl)glucosamine N-acyltransferase n=1 Tax=Roseococcus sp. SYP-B2431 TaxID=2496640 RepID=UPI0010396984|nr:UDP-3-O-(3-hydroxymyristoyl)glucosamine N-acyltransferase [Roseococcus sp. SYP-B2431]TCH97656.1 UDP-3-O-(3-hydroxymyristoyl)glucosamine N-acyltransferase [Roseococcus sp. SYP-B2431]
MSADARFFGYAGPLPLTTIAAAAGGVVHGHSERLFAGVGSLEAATPDEVSFCEAPRYVTALRATRAGAVLVPEALANQVPEGCVAITCSAPAAAFGKVAVLFHPRPRPQARIDPSAILGPDVVIGEGAEIGPMSVIGAGARIGDGCLIGPLVTVGPGVVLGARCVLHSHASISHAICAEGVVLHPGARVGQEGFGFAVTPDGRFETAPQLGLVELGRGVEIGANSCVDRGTLANTVLGEGTRLDNLVQVGHNVRTGRGCIMVAQVGVSGSTVMGDYVSAGGQAGFSGHLSIGSRARIGAQAGVIQDLPAEAEVFGTPAVPVREAFRSLRVLRRLTAESRHMKRREAE